MNPTPRQLEAVELSKQMSQREVAERMNISQPAVNKLLRKARAQGVITDNPPITPTRRNQRGLSPNASDNPPSAVPETTGSGSPLKDNAHLDAHNLGYITDIHKGKHILFGKKTGKYPPQYISECNGFRVMINTSADKRATTIETRPLPDTVKTTLRNCDNSLERMNEILDDEAQKVNWTLMKRHGLELSCAERNRDAHYCITNDRLAHELMKGGSHPEGELRLDKSPDPAGTLESNKRELIQGIADLPGAVSGLQAQMENLNAQLGGLQTLPQVLEKMNETLNHVVRTQVQLANANLAAVKVQKRKATAPEDIIIRELFGGR